MTYYIADRKTRDAIHAHRLAEHYRMLAISDAAIERYRVAAGRPGRGPEREGE